MSLPLAFAFRAATGLFASAAETASSTVNGWCSLEVLRGGNVAFYLLFSLLLFQSQKHHRHLTTTLALILFPPLVFFSFLYYTDVASTFLVLLSLNVGRRGHFLFSALISLLSLFMRQTNVVWVAFIAFDVLHRQLILLHRKRSPPAKFPSSVNKCQITHQIPPPTISIHLSSTQVFSSRRPPTALEELHMVLSINFDDLLKLTRSIVPYALVVLSFGFFVVWNGGIVLGW